MALLVRASSARSSTRSARGTPEGCFTRAERAIPKPNQWQYEQSCVQYTMTKLAACACCLPQWRNNRHSSGSPQRFPRDTATLSPGMQSRMRRLYNERRAMFQNTDEQERAYAPPERRMTQLSASQPTSLDTGS
jgi:hypothetical protein